VSATPEEELSAAVRQAITEAEEVAGWPEAMLTLQTDAAVGAVLRLGWVRRAGWEYAVKAGDVTEAAGFNTEGQAQAWVDAHPGSFEIVRRPVGVWEGA
jgi:hypothetical protein